MTLAQTLINGLGIGAVYALFAIGYALVFSLLRLIHFAHAALFSLGAYLSWSLHSGQWGGGVLPLWQSSWPLPLPLALGLSMLLTAGFSLAIERFVYRPLRQKQAEPLLTLVASLGLTMLLTQALLMIYGAETKNFAAEDLDVIPALVSFGGLHLRGIQLVNLVLSSLVIGFFYCFFRFSLFGKALQAIAENPKASALLGIPVNRVLAWVFACSGALAALSGSLVAFAFSIPGPHFGLLFGLKGLAVMVLGGMGEISGVLLGGLVLGLLEALVPSEFSGYKDAIAFLLLFLCLLWKPDGLLGKKYADKL